MKTELFNTILKTGIFFSFLFWCFVFWGVMSTQASEAGICSSTADVVLVMDRSGSMEDGGRESSCVWQELEWVSEDTQQCMEYTQTGVDQSWCEDKSHSSCASSEYISAQDNKMTAAQKAGGTFLDLLSGEDQSGLVYFSYLNDGEWLAELKKELSGDHDQTKQLLDQLEPFGPTNIGDAIALATEEFSSSRTDPQAIKAAILLTDGLANKPFGDGSKEDQQDVDYAIKKAEEAGNKGIKVFTIGLGGTDEINEVMLNTIAETTGADYYYAPDQSELEDIYNLISTRICEYSSISGCKFNDLNRNSQKDEKEKFLEGWEISLKGNGVDLTQSTDSEGCYQFSGLGAGEYVITEATSSDWVQTFPENGYYELDLDWEEDLKNKDFGNYKKAEPLGSVKVCKYKDEDGLASTKDDRTPLTDVSWEFILKNNSASSSFSTLATTSDDHCVVFDQLPFGDHRIQEVSQDKWFLLEPETVEVEININSTTQETIEFVNYYKDNGGDNGGNGSNGGGGEKEPVCGNGVLERGEECDDGNTKDGDGCNSSCQKERKSGGSPVWIFKAQTPEEPEPLDPVVITTVPILKIQKTVDKDVINPGDEVVYEIILVNEGSGKALNVRVSDDLPMDFSYESGDDPEELLFAEELLPQEQRRMEFTAKVSTSAESGSYFNQVKASSDNHDTVQSVAEVEVEPKKEVKGDKVKETKGDKVEEDVLPPAGFDPGEFLFLSLFLFLFFGGALFLKRSNA